MHKPSVSMHRARQRRRIRSQVALTLPGTEATVEAAPQADDRSLLKPVCAPPQKKNRRAFLFGARKGWLPALRATVAHTSPRHRLETAALAPGPASPNTHHYFKNQKDSPIPRGPARLRGAPSGGPVPPALLLQDVPQDDFSPAQKREPHVRGCGRMLDARYPVAAAVHPSSPDRDTQTPACSSPLGWAALPSRGDGDPAPAATGRADIPVTGDGPPQSILSTRSRWDSPPPPCPTSA